MTENSLGTRIKKARNTAGILSKDLAKRLDIAYQTLSRYENNEYPPDADTLRKIAIITKVSAGWLLTGIDAEMLEVYNVEEKEFCKKLLRIMRTKQEKTVIAIKQNLDAFLDNPDRERTPVPKKAASNEK